MIYYAYATIAFLMLYWIGQLILVIAYASRFYRSQPAEPAEEWPKFSVLMPLRGADPFLATAIRSVIEQDYPNFDFHIIVDSESDPAWKIVCDTLGDSPDESIRVTALENRSESCSLFCSTIIQFLDEIEKPAELIAMCHADMKVPHDWLRNMAAALRDPKVGTTLGNRWYVPEQWQLGSLVRYLWNAGAVMPMWLFEIPWGGTMAMRYRDLKSSGLSELYSRGMVDDAPLKTAYQKLNLRMKFVPQLMIANREEIDFPSSYRFIKRQMLWSRLYHPNWIWVVLCAIAGSLAIFAPLLVAFVAFVASEHEAMLFACAGWIAYILAQTFLLCVIEVAIQRVLSERGEKTTKLTPATILRWMVAIPLAQAVFMLAVIACMFIRKIAWRGINYEINGPWKIKMLEYRPFQQADESNSLPRTSL